MESVLGISLGTRQVGIAILRNNELVDWHLRSFPAQWSKNKLKKIIGEIDTLIHDHSVKIIAVKIPGMLPSFRGFTQLIGALNVLLERKGIKAEYYTLTDIQEHFSPEKKIYKDTIAAVLTDKHPELLTIYSKGKEKRDRYYGKIFDAVAAACLLQQEPNLDRK